MTRADSRPMIRGTGGLSTLLLILAAWGCAPPADRRPFTLVMLPDTQNYSRFRPDLFFAQTRWIKANVEKENIVFVTQVGDIVNDHARDEYQWRSAAGAMAVLDGAVPWGVAIGNHDYDSIPKRKTGGADTFRRYFGPGRFAGRPWYAGASPNGLNSAQLFSGGGVDFLILHLEVDFPEPAVDWARGMIARYPTRAVILSTHIYLKGREGVGRHPRLIYRPDGHSAEELWHRFIRPCRRIFLVLCGHESRTDEYRQVSINDAGRPVHEILADYQSRPRGGDGFLRLLRFDPVRREILVRTYSPDLDRFEADESSAFTLPWIIPEACLARTGT